MKTTAMEGLEQPVDLSGLQARAQKAGLEAGWTGSEEWTQVYGDLLRGELRMIEQRLRGPLQQGPGELQGERQRLEARRHELTAMQASHHARVQKRAAEQGFAAWSWDTRRAVMIAGFLGLCGLGASAFGFTVGWKGWLALALAGVLLGVRPWGVAAGARAFVIGLAADVSYLVRARRLARLNKRIDEVDAGLTRESERERQSAEWVDQHLEWLTSQYLVAKSRGDKARLIAAQSQS
jgi:hypothetical protein